MPELADLFVKLDLRTKGFQKGIKKADRAMDTLKKSVFSLKGAVVGLSGTMAGIQLAKGVKEAIQLANEQEAVEHRLAAVIKSTGQAAGYSLKQLKDMAAALQQTSTVGDEVILAGMGILATFKQVKGEAFEGAMQAALDMSEVMQQDLKSSVIMIGKAMNDPVANLSAMTRAGVQFTQSQKEMIKQLWASGDVLGAQKIVLGELISQFGEAAVAAIKTFGGATLQAKNAWSDLGETLGFAVTKNEYFIKGMRNVKTVFEEWDKQLKSNQSSLGALAKEGFTGLVGAIESTVNVGSEMYLTFLKVRQLFDWLIKTGAGAMNKIAEGWRLLLGKDTLKVIQDLADSTSGLYKQHGQEILGLEGKIEGWKNKYVELKKSISDVQETAKKAAKEMKSYYDHTAQQWKSSKDDTVIEPKIKMSPAVPFRQGIENMKELLGSVGGSGVPINFDASGLNDLASQIRNTQVLEGYYGSAQGMSNLAPGYKTSLVAGETQMRELREMQMEMMRMQLENMRYSLMGQERAAQKSTINGPISIHLPAGVESMSAEEQARAIRDELERLSQRGA